MKYMGSKNRYAKYILPIILKDRKPNQYYVEPFCGGCNLIDKVENPRIANDIHYYLIEMWRALLNGWKPPKLISREKYKHIQQNCDDYPPYLVGYTGFNSYGAKFFGGYRADKEGKRDYWDEHYRNIMKQLPKLKGIKLFNLDYKCLSIPPNSIIYCDIPYANTTKYKYDFDHSSFWNWANNMTRQDHKVFVSEYNAPIGWECVWSKKVNNTLVQNTGSKKGTEKLFTK